MSQKEKKTKFSTDIEEMMFGFGDSWPPNPEAVSLVEILVTQYIEDLASRAIQIAELRGKLDKECFMFLVRKDQHKFQRIQNLLAANEELKAAQKIRIADDI
jgi:transcription initiation factor TFIID subunit 13